MSDVIGIRRPEDRGYAALRNSADSGNRLPATRRIETVLDITGARERSPAARLACIMRGFDRYAVNATSFA
jgi:hypothetical protein